METDWRPALKWPAQGEISAVNMGLLQIQMPVRKRERGEAAGDEAAGTV